MSKGLIRAFSTVGGWTMASRILGLVREMLMARAIGTSPMADAFLTAFRLPNMFRRFLAEGAFNSAFVPMFRKRADDIEASRAFAQNAFSGLATIALILILLVQILTPAFVVLLSHGFSGDERLPLAVNYTRVTIFYIFFMSLAALLSGVLNSFNRFAMAAAAPVVLNVIMVAALTLMLFVDVANKGMVLSIAVFLAGLAQFAMLWWGAKKLGIKLGIKLPKWNADMKDLVRLALPSTFAAGVTQINLVVGAQIASTIVGAQSWLYYADRLYQLPLGVIGVAIGIVLLPSLTSMIKENDVEGGQIQLNTSVLFAMLLTIPSAAALFAIAGPLIQVLFEGGAFNRADTIATASAVSIYALGLPAFVLHKIYQPLYFAREDTRSPFRFALWSMVLNVVIAVGLMNVIGYMAPVWSSVISAWVMAFMLWRGTKSFGAAAVLTSATKRSIAIFFGAAIAMGCVSLLLSNLGASILEHGLGKWIMILIIISVSAALYFGIVMMVAKIRPSDIKKMMRR